MGGGRGLGRLAFAGRMALREGRAGARRVGGFALAIALGVGALVGLDGFQRDAGEASRGEARQLMGGDVRVESQQPLGESVEALLDSLAAEPDVGVGRVTSVGTMVRGRGADGISGEGRLLQVQAVDDGFPVLAPETEADGALWDRLRAERGALAEARVLEPLGVGVGDSLDVGGVGVEVLGAVAGLPVDPGVQFVAGPPVWVHADVLEAAGLLATGSLVRHRAFIALPPGGDPDALAALVRTRAPEGAAGGGVRVRTAEAEAEDIAEGFRTLARFLGLVGLVALLLGGIGVASAVHVHIRSRIPAIAVLRCMGASSGTVFLVYLLQALLLGVAGSVLGVGLGLAIQFGLPGLLSGILPFEVSPRLHPGSVGLGMGMGTGVALLFALLPLLAVRDVPPLAALRLEVEGRARGAGVLRAAVVVLVFVAVTALASVQAGGVLPGVVLAVACAGVLGVLGLLGSGMARLARRLLPAGAPFAVRQGVSGLFRPGNQTTAVMMALGFGTFLVGAMVVAADGLAETLRLDADGSTPSLFVFDVQPDQVEGVEAVLGELGARVELAPVVPSRLRADGLGEDVPGWVLRRVYRNTWAEEPRATERLVDGTWWPAGEAEARTEPEAVREAVAEGAARVSVEVELAGDLGVGVGDRLLWDVQGRAIPSVVTSLREVDWTSFRPNFFAVFEPGVLDGAPATWIGAVSAAEGRGGGELEAALRSSHPNVSWVDVSTVRETVERIATRVLQVLGALTGFVVAGGVLVLLAALLAGRYHRRREAALLRTLGAGGRRVRAVFVVEYAVLGALAGLAGLLLGAGGGLALLRWGFELGGGVPWLRLGAVWAGTTALVLLAGWLTAGPVLRAPPIVVLRAAEGEGG